MKKLILISVLAALCLIRSAQAQAIPTSGIGIGDPVPEVLLTRVINPNGAPLKLSDYHGKLLLLDFWASWCSSCIENLPRIEGLAEKYKDRFAVLGVDDEPKAKVDQFFRTRNARGEPLRFTTTYGDTLLRKLFPHTAIPHCIWISPEGRVAAITGAAEVTEESVLAALGGHPLDLITKRDIDPQQPLFLNQWFHADSLQHYYIFIKGSYPGTGSSSPVRVKGTDTVGQAFTNTSLLGMYEVLAARQYKKTGEAHTEHLLLETPDSSKLSRAYHEVKYVQSNPGPYAYNVDFIVPRSKKDSVFLLMIRELNQSTGYSATFEKRKVSVLALQRISPGIPITTKGGSPVYLTFQGGPAVAVNQTMKAVVARLNSLPGIPSQIIDETGITNKVDLRFTGETGLSTLQRDLEQQGLRLIKKEVMLTALVISGRPGQ